MTEQQPSSAATDAGFPADARDDLTAAAVLSDDSATRIGGARAAHTSLTGLASGGSAVDGQAANDAAIERDAVAAASRTAPEPHPQSQ